MKPLIYSILNTAAIFITAVILSSCGCKLQQVVCPDKSVVFVRPCPTKQYEDIAKNFDLNVKGALNVLDKVKLEAIDAHLKKDVQNLRDKIDQYSGRGRDILTAALDQSNRMPCDAEIQRNFQNLLASMSSQSLALEELKGKVDGALKGGSLSGASVDESVVKSALSRYEGTSDALDKIKVPTK